MKARIGKMLCTGLAGALIASPLVWAVEGAQAGENASARQTARLQRQLGLTDEQTQKIQEILKENAPAARPARPEWQQGSRPDAAAVQKWREARRERAQKREQVQNQINEVLTEEQRQKYELLKQNRGMRKGQWGHPGKRLRGVESSWAPEPQQQQP